ncbi:MAG: ECF-type sigma factor [Acidobacteriota bacterium]
MSRPRPRTAALTELLVAWSDGDDEALEELTPMVYQELHRLAHHYLLGERHRGLQTTELVSEAFLRLVDNHISWSGRAHFYVVAARTMRRVLVDLARRRQAGKRDGIDRQVPLLDGDQLDIGLVAPGDTARVDLLALDQALGQLARADERKSQAVELRYFGGLPVAEIARVLNVSLPTAERDLRLARAWLGQAIQGAGTS